MEVQDMTKQEISSLIADPQAIRARLAQNVREAEILKRLLKTAEFAAEKLNAPEVAAR